MKVSKNTYKFIENRIAEIANRLYEETNNWAAVSSLRTSFTEILDQYVNIEEDENED